MTLSTHSRGFSLVITLIILTLLSILIVSFMSTTALDRVTAGAFANKAQAELAADTAVNQAISLLTDAITQYPDSATVWEPLTSPGGYGTEGTVLYYADTPPPTSVTQKDYKTPERYVLPLVSRGADADGVLPGAVKITQKDIALGTAGWDDQNSIDLNRPRSNEDTVGWIGTPPPPPPSTVGPTAPKPFRAKWIEVKEPATPGKTARVTSRYAFWVEDESFKVNLNQLGAERRSSETPPPNIPPPPGVTYSPGSLPKEIPIQGLLRSAHAPVDYDTIARQARDLRDSFVSKRLLDLASFNQPRLEWEENGKTRYLGEGTKFLATIFSGGLNLSRQGSQRLNLNGLGFQQPMVTIKELGQVVETIKYHAPKFGERFYRNTPPATIPTAKWCNDEYVTPEHQNIYLYKIAANIRDYIDPDSQPTLLVKPASGSVPDIVGRGKPSGPMWADDSENKFWAQGKEGQPFIQEAVVRFRSSVASDKSYTLKTDYYLEVWNMTDKQVLAKDMNNPFIEITEAPGWFGHRSGPAGNTSAVIATNNTPTAGSPEESREMIIDLLNGVKKKGTDAADGVVFEPGTFTVITTDPDGLPTTAGGSIPAATTAGGLNTENTYVCLTLKSGKRVFTGSLPANSDGMWMVWRDAVDSNGKGVSDYRSGVVLGNDLGYLDCASYAFAMNNSSTGPYVTYADPKNGAVSRDDTYGGSLLGNSITPSQLGDPRTNNEQLVFQRYKSGGVLAEPDPTRYANPPSDTYRFSLAIQTPASSIRTSLRIIGKTTTRSG